MKSPKTFLLLSIIVAVLVLGIAYAAISSVTLNVTGNVVAAPSDANFKVAFDRSSAPTTSGVGTINATYTDDLNADVKITGWTKKGDTATIVFKIKNNSADLAATLTKTVSTASKFTITAELSTTRIEKGETAELTVVVTLNETPISANIACDFDVAVIAAPSDPS